MHCQHPECDCATTTVERNGKNFCSNACATGAANMAADDEEGCGCGHPDCGSETASASRGSEKSGGVSARGAEGAPSGMRAGGDGSSRGLTGDGLVGDEQQRQGEKPGRGGTDDARKLRLSDEDRGGAPMKPGAVQQRGTGDDGMRRASVRHSDSRQDAGSIEAPSRDDR